MMLSYLRDKLKEFGFSDIELLKCEIALEEVLVNIINYAYKGEVGDIDLNYAKENEYLIIRVKDTGIPFNPLEHTKKYDTSASLEEREVGGLGIIMMKEFMDEIQYERKGDTNILTLKKRLPV